jgi:hypothetical protein
LVIPLELRLCVSISTLLCATLLSEAARAEGYLIDGSFGLGSGFEGGDTGSGQLGWRRARMRLVGGVDLRDDESRGSALGLRAFAEVEKRASVGAEVRYERWLTKSVGVYAGLTGTVAPETLFGADFGATLVIPFGERVGLYLEPSFGALPLGSDLPQGSVLLWGLFLAGIQLGL